MKVELSKGVNCQPEEAILFERKKKQLNTWQLSNNLCMSKVHGSALDKHEGQLRYLLDLINVHNKWLISPSSNL